jgi:hypothetical protein
MLFVSVIALISAIAGFGLYSTIATVFSFVLLFLAIAADFIEYQAAKATPIDQAPTWPEYSQTKSAIAHGLFGLALLVIFV